ncbi:SAC3 family protein B isoform X2 [Cynara cardunculus var. scolymus]|uniref:SAC3 family protein B isoform X2 n=1 Tax=Cynara cardunculus var. scolymus TaxID=59895 RepID=UPI000D625FE5|nr:SAC3 family protein B isoform X2 [Cynara cardunculus var. scolymus]
MQGFDKNSGPGAGIPKQQPPFGYRPSSQSPSSGGTSLKPEGHRSPALSPIIPSRNPGTEFPAKIQLQDLKRTRSPPLLSTDKELLQNSRTVVGSHSVPLRTKSPPHIYQKSLPGKGFGPSSETKRPSVSPPRLSTRLISQADPESHVWSPPSADFFTPEAPATNPSDIPVPKRSRLPFPASTDPALRMNNSVVHDDTERELQAKAKRLARFKDELSQPEPSDTGNRNQKTQQLGQLGMDKRKLNGEASDLTASLRNSNTQTDGEDQDSSTVIIGYCPDMCPEQERAERERKGDLDQYERLDGHRNQTTEYLAVKKYTRTAEREAALIRPMAILQKTMDYLLNLLDQHYDDRFLGLYNFLWDRMRAIRMDLRMQHIFNLGAITMLEQMIRLHIIAMHELCQYTKGEGFSEGFDAHLNIEQMNKTSVELFQLYDDHRKKGTEVPTEREFRGYYALLKLDKHPGYKVEPAELSLDLAKMTPGIRQTAEVLFARNVARACRTGNFIAFFRLVRKASYLQACLMHAHFGKLRTQALASLHSGLQNNQGIPVTQVAKWLGMEDENMEDLLEYHGFFIKEFEEPYMVKEQQFLNGDTEYPLKCSTLVHRKRSTVVIEDVLSSSLMESSPPEDPKGLHVDMVSMQEESPVVHEETQSNTKAVDRDMADYGAVKDELRVQPMLSSRWNEDRHHMEVESPSLGDIFKTNNSFGSPKVITSSVGKPSFDKRFRNSLEKHGQSNTSSIPPQVTPRQVFVETLPDLQIDSSVEDSVVHPDFVEGLEPEEPENVIQEVQNEIDTSINEEVAEAKLRLILRLWRRRTLIKKDLRDKKQLAANAALSSLSLGLSMRQYKEQLKIPGDFNIDRAVCERFEKQEQLWSTLNVSNVVADTLGERYQYPRCICWKLLFCSSDFEGEKLESGCKVSNLDPASWLRYKLMPEKVADNDDLVASFPGLSIWKKWDYGKSAADWICYLSVVKNIQFDHLLEETVLGASAVMFLASESISWDAQKIRLRKLVSSIPHGSCLPLLILSCSDPSIMEENLGLNEVDKSRICSFSVVPLVEINQKDGFFSDNHLRKGLEWLASQSPLQPVVHHVKTHELVLTHLQFSSNMQFDGRKTSPEHCISAINEAVDKSIEEISDAAKSNPVCWPCPEISLLSESDHRILESYLPSIGWSSGTRIDPLIQALRNCKLPTVPEEIYRRFQHPLTGTHIENQRLELDHFLVSYLSPLMGPHLAQKEASILIQNCVGLELNGSTYCLVPNWLMIFRRVFNWLLMSLYNGAFATTYILDDPKQKHNHVMGSKSLKDETYNLISPSLDEMIEVSGCMPNTLELELELELESKDLKATVCDPPEVEMVVNGDDMIPFQEERNERKENGSSLSRLLEQCKIVQDIIDKKLSVYF